MLVAALQAPPPHTVPAGYLRQPPAPSQVPSVAQLAGGWDRHMPRVSAPPAAIRLQRPGCVPAAHVRQAPAQASSQQTPSLQMPLAHWLASLHAWPRPLGPQLPPMQAGASPLQSAPSGSCRCRRRSCTGTGRSSPCRRPCRCPGRRSGWPPPARCRWSSGPAGRWFRAGTCEQTPRPSQRPLKPQPAAPVSAQRPIGSLVPAGTGWQLPSDPGRRQLKQASSQRLLQQVPPTQWPLWQSTSWVQLAPSSRGPHDPATHITPDTQPAPSWQLGLQRGAPSTTLQANGAQGTAGPATQLPAPSQDDPAVMLLPEQTPSPQRTPAGYLRQAPRPSQVPSKPQLSGGCHAAAGVVAALGGVSSRCPRCRRRCRHGRGALQELAQQTPSTQKSLRHWLLAVQMAPLGRSVPLTIGAVGAAVAGAAEVDDHHLHHVLLDHHHPGGPGQHHLARSQRVDVAADAATGVSVRQVHHQIDPSGQRPPRHVGAHLRVPIDSLSALNTNASLHRLQRARPVGEHAQAGDLRRRTPGSRAQCGGHTQTQHHTPRCGSASPGPRGQPYD